MRVLLERASISALSEQLQTGCLSSVRLVEQVLEDIERYNRQLNAVVALDRERALRDAEISDELLRSGARRSALEGIPLGIKDIIDCEGMATTFGCGLFLNNKAVQDAAVVEHLRNSGAIILGKTNTHQIAMGCTGDRSCFGPVRNPYDTSRMTGGSSSGSAAAVASGLLPGALGTDTGGSIRIPSALCGVVGLKPSRGRVSLRGVLPVWPYSDYIGPICRTVRDCAIMLDAIEGYDPQDSISRRLPPCDAEKACGESVEGLVIGCPTEELYRQAEPEIADAIFSACQELKNGGAIVLELSWPDMSEYRRAQKMVLHWQCYHRHRDNFEQYREQYDPEVLDRLENGIQTGMSYEDAQAAVADFSKQFTGMMYGLDAMLLPSVNTTAPLLQQRMIQTAGGLRQLYEPFTGFLWQASAAGLPALALPAGLHKGLPIGIQLVGGDCGEALLCQIGSFLSKN